MKKCLYTICVDNYFPELMRYTLPNLANYAQKIEAQFHIITERKFPDFPPTYEKMQIYELGKGNDWNILVDADSMFYPGMFDPTIMVPPDHVGYYMSFDASLLFECDQYFFRDGRNMGVASNFMCVPRACHDLWTPLEFSAEIAKTKTKRWFIVDEYCISRNLARFGLKHTGILDGEFQKLLTHFDVNTVSPNKEEVIARAKKYHEEWKW